MKIRTQDAKRYLDYTEIYADLYGSRGQAAVYAMSQFHREPVCVGVYEDMERAKGILKDKRVKSTKRHRVDRENRPSYFGECRGGFLVRFGNVHLLPGI